MSKNKVPSTSLAAYRSLEPAKLSKMHNLIIEALTVLGEANYEGISAYLKMKEEKVWKRINEVVKLGAIHNTQKTVMTKNNRMSYLYGIGPGTGVPKKEKVLTGKTVQDFSKAILNQPMPSLAIQTQLF